MFDFVNDNNIPKSTCNPLPETQVVPNMGIPTIFGTAGEFDNTRDYSQYWNKTNVWPERESRMTNPTVTIQTGYGGFESLVNSQLGEQMKNADSIPATLTIDEYKRALEQYGGDQAIAYSRLLDNQRSEVAQRDRRGIYTSEEMKEIMEATPRKRANRRANRSTIPAPEPLSQEEQTLINEYKQFLENNPI